MSDRRSIAQLGEFLRELRHERGISQLLLADAAEVCASVVQRAERGENVSHFTWQKLFGGLGYRLLIDVIEESEDWPDYLRDEAERRRERQREGVCSGKRRFW